MNTPTLAALLLLAGATHAEATPSVDAGDLRLSRSGAMWLLDGKPYSGLITTHAHNGAHSELPIRDGLREGIERRWYPNSHLAEQRGYHAGKKNGAQQLWWPDGSPRLDAAMQDDRNTGTVRTYFPGGRPYEEHRYDQAGQESGPQRVWYEDGGLRANYSVRDGRRYGTTGPMECAGRDQNAQGGPPRAGAAMNRPPPPRGAFGNQYAGAQGQRPFPPGPPGPPRNFNNGFPPPPPPGFNGGPQ